MPFPTPIDIVSVLWFFSLWIGYNLIADSERLRHKSVVGMMHEQSRRWMKEMLQRDMRMLDTMILNHLQAGIRLFASTSILASAAWSRPLAPRTRPSPCSLPYPSSARRPVSSGR